MSFLHSSEIAGLKLKLTSNWINIICSADTSCFPSIKNWTFSLTNSAISNKPSTGPSSTPFVSSSMGGALIVSALTNDIWPNLLFPSVLLSPCWNPKPKRVSFPLGVSSTFEIVLGKTSKAILRLRLNNLVSKSVGISGRGSSGLSLIWQSSSRIGNNDLIGGFSKVSSSSPEFSLSESSPYPATSANPPGRSGGRSCSISAIMSSTLGSAGGLIKFSTSCGTSPPSSWRTLACFLNWFKITVVSSSSGFSVSKFFTFDFSNAVVNFLTNAWIPTCGGAFKL